MVSGRNFSTAYPTDSTGFILNEAALGVLGWKTPQEAIGKVFAYGGNKGHVIGIMNDFHFESMHQKILPLIFIPINKSLTPNYISLKLAGGNIQNELSELEQLWKKYLPDDPFQYSFLDDRFAQLYEAEHRQGALFTTFSMIAIFIACLGLFGLSAFTISQRVKEIGVRKVLGASVGNIVTLISKDFLKLVLVATIIAFPIAWLVMNKWLNDFAYRIGIPWWVFLLAGILAASIAFITISLQAIKAALSNPTKSLRTE